MPVGLPCSTADASDSDCPGSSQSTLGPSICSSNLLLTSVLALSRRFVSTSWSRHSNSATYSATLFEDPHMPEAAREMKRGLAIAILLIDRITASVQEGRDLQTRSIFRRPLRTAYGDTPSKVSSPAQTPLAAREMKRGVASTIYAVKRRPSIKVQRARCDVTSLCKIQVR